MHKQYLIIINNNLKPFTNLINHWENVLPYETVILMVDELLHGKLTSTLADYRIYDVLLIIDSVCFNQREEEIHEYFQVIFNHPFKGILQLFTDPLAFQEYLAQPKGVSCFLLYGEYDQDKTTCYFLMHVNEIFEKATIAFRLSDYIYHSFEGAVSAEVLRMKKIEIERLNQELELRNRIDPLTNLFNRRALFEFLEKEHNRTVRNLFKIGAQELSTGEDKKAPNENAPTFTTEFIEGNIIIFSLMMIDLDHFKYINDTYGHLAGDTVLKALGNIFKDTGILREQDVVGRFGGEEFIIILPGTKARCAIEPAKRLARQLAGISFEGTEGETFSVTMSIGISEYHLLDKTGDAIIHRADKALYLAKERGRNLIVAYEDEFPLQADS